MSSIIGERASIKAGARYGGKGFARGAFIPKYLIGSIVTIDEVQEGQDGTECRLAELPMLGAYEVSAFFGEAGLR